MTVPSNLVLTLATSSFQAYLDELQYFTPQPILNSILENQGQHIHNLAEAIQASMDTYFKHME